MGLFDGPARRFAETFREYLDARATVLEENAAKQADPYTKLCDAVIAATMREISTALKTIAEL